jgi:cytochrome c-type biogenesis protein
MGLALSDLPLAFAAGLASVASPCVLPVVPLLVAGGAREHRARPALLVAGLAASFTAMGVLTSLAGAAVGRVLPAMEKGFAVLVIAFGLLLLADVNVFKRLGWLQRVPSPGGGGSGLLLGFTLGIVWIPCVGPVLSGVLAAVATRGSVASGVALLLAYSAGFSAPMLALAYGSQALRTRVRAVASHPVAVRWASGALLVAFGALVLQRGMLFAGS